MLIRCCLFLIRSLFLLLLLYLLTALSAILINKKRYQPDAHPAEQKILYLYHDFAHTELILHAGDLSSRLRNLLSPYIPDIDRGYIAFSYGDAVFMQNTPEWKDTDTPTALRALFLNTPGAIRVGHYRAIRHDGSIVPIHLPKKRLQKIEDAVSQSFLLKAGAPVPFTPDKGSGYIYYFHAKHPYNLFYTCNEWSADMLRAGGLPQPLWTPFSFGVVYPF